MSTPGFNLIGYVSGNLGVGVTARAIARVILDKGYGLRILDLDPGADRGGYDTAFTPFTVPDASGLPFDVNLYVLPLGSFGPATDAVARQPGRLNAGFAIWELAHIPPTMRAGLSGMDVLIGESFFIRDNLRACFPDIPALYAAHPLYLPAEVTPDRRGLGLPEDGVIFLTSLDLMSDLERKNLFAVLDAFQAGPGRLPKAHLVIKMRDVSDGRGGSMLQPVKHLARSNPRIHILTDERSYRQTLALYASCDVFVSLHRAEGLGLCLMEAMALGKPVVATQYSGNLTYMRPENSCLVPYALTPVHGVMPLYDTGFLGPEAVWAEPDVAVAGGLMTRLALSARLREGLGDRARQDMASFEATARQGNFLDALLGLLEPAGHGRKRGGSGRP